MYLVATEKNFDRHMVQQPSFFKSPNLVVIKKFGYQDYNNQKISIATQGGSVICF
jgi:hypothetical protein